MLPHVACKRRSSSNNRAASKFYFAPDVVLKKFKLRNFFTRNLLIAHCCVNAKCDDFNLHRQ